MIEIENSPVHAPTTRIDWQTVDRMANQVAYGENARILRTYLNYCRDVADARNSISQLRQTRPELFEIPERKKRG
jgi:hypothetical protein